ncbi:hypothetical protein [Spirochaeta isovalerica]|uniref:Uncharacterized protein n=1 Tax=Spirochaeta isovalerica TaxID=150 RepID=A0A841RI83_9SPIO|nr:hypothetical protein [Spirochaeta isovalerica]MBB6482710.1 hypothetical protein [Spirochaeta isovalerica]
MKPMRRQLSSGMGGNLHRYLNNIINSEIEPYSIRSGHLFYNDNFITKSPKIFIDYWLNEKGVIYSDSFVSRQNIFLESIFSGMDVDGNYYWSNGSGLWTFNTYGELMNIIITPMTDSVNSEMIRFVIDDKGNAYRIVRNTKYELKMLRRSW